jgi:hypothetical protein
MLLAAGSSPGAICRGLSVPSPPSFPPASSAWYLGFKESIKEERQELPITESPVLMLYKVTVVTFYWSKQVKRPTQIQEQGIWTLLLARRMNTESIAIFCPPHRGDFG